MLVKLIIVFRKLPSLQCSLYQNNKTDVINDIGFNYYHNRCEE